MKLTDICDFQGGSQPPKEEWSFEAKEGYIRMLQIRDFTQSEKVTPEYVKISNSTKICEADDILIARYGASIGKILTGLAGAYNVAIMRTIPDTNKIQKKYLYYYLKSSYFQKSILNVGSRAAQAGFNKEDLSKIHIKCPNKEEQDNIINILEKIELIIKKKKDELFYLDNLIKARFVEMFGNIILNDKGWKTDTWSNALKIVNGKNQKAVESDDGEYLICGSGGAMGRATEYLTNENSVIIGRKGSINKPLLMREKYWNVDTAFGIEPNRKYINVDYLYMFCVFFNFEQLNKAVTIPSLTKADLLNIEMPIPNILLQEQFADFVKQVDKSKFMKSF